MIVTIPVSVGELLDKITILEIKRRRVSDPRKSRNITTELELLREVLRREVTTSPGLETLVSNLRVVNELLWNIEDEIRKHESKQDFSDEFVSLARSVYQQNDERAHLKAQINDLMGSTLREEKSYESSY